MGLAPARGDEIDGKESITLYRTFEGSFDEREKNELRGKILLHNHDDILQLYKIFPIILQTDIHKAMSSLGFPIAGQSQRGFLLVLLLSSCSTSVRLSFLPGWQL